MLAGEPVKVQCGGTPAFYGVESCEAARSSFFFSFSYFLALAIIICHLLLYPLRVIRFICRLTFVSLLCHYCTFPSLFVRFRVGFRPGPAEQGLCLSIFLGTVMFD